ncbi:MAG: hypothetical protein GTO22_10015 [Gemmatimonadales bacterium]|nr:hypothetical protein [Gemmatimonadales bacterium]
MEFARLVGQWLRPDRGYIVSIESVESDGKTSAAYYNPHPIHVARAEGHRDGRALQLFVELQDVGYPGSYYRLTHDAATDQLSGIYYQAAQGVTYEVYFVRRQ